LQAGLRVSCSKATSKEIKEGIREDVQEWELLGERVVKEFRLKRKFRLTKGFRLVEKEESKGVRSRRTC
jgi:hypothetical protein